MGADHPFELISIVHRVPQFFMHNKSNLGGVKNQMRIQNFDDHVSHWLQANYEYDEKHGQDRSANDKMHSYTRL